MIDLLQASQDAIFAALKPIEAIAGMPGGLKVWVSVPEKAQPPMIVVGQMTSETADEHGDQVEMVTAEIHCVYRGAKRDELLAMMHQVRAALDAQALPSEAAVLEPPRWQRAAAGDVLEDGVTYVGITIFEFMAEPV